MSDDKREALALRFGGDLTAREIARLTGNSLTAIETRISRRLRRLRQQLDE